MGTSLADPLHMQDHFVQFVHSAGAATRVVLSCSYFGYAALGLVWQERNIGIFKAKESTVLQLLEKIKVSSLCG
jgi:hypothetical protein